MSDGGVTPPALTVSCTFGILGIVLFLIGAALDSETMFVLGAAAGALSLGSALYWRAELIESWHGRRRSPPG